MNCRSSRSCSGDRFNWSIMCSMGQLSATRPRSNFIRLRPRVARKRHQFALVYIFSNNNSTTILSFCAIAPTRRTKQTKIANANDPLLRLINNSLQLDSAPRIASKKKDACSVTSLSSSHLHPAGLFAGRAVWGHRRGIDFQE